MEKIKVIFKKLCSKEVILYVVFGVLTTLINIGSFYILTELMHLEENIANIISIILAVLAAYFTNRKWVFNSGAVTLKEKFTEFYKFIIGRAFTMVVEIVGFFLLFNIFHIQELISKAVITVIVIVLNYFISKFFAFKKKSSD